MPVEVRVPALGESILEATVSEWLKAEGDPVAVGDPLVELETEKVAVEVAAEEPGVLERIVHREGDTVHVGDVLALLADGSRARAAAAGAAPTAPPKETPSEQAAAAMIVVTSHSSRSVDRSTANSGTCRLASKRRSRMKANFGNAPALVGRGRPHWG